VTISAWEGQLYRQDFNNVAGDYATSLPAPERISRQDARDARHHSSNEATRRFTSYKPDPAGYGALRLLVPRVTTMLRAFERNSVKPAGDFSIGLFAAVMP
jgi:hypothetical protein